MNPAIIVALVLAQSAEPQGGARLELKPPANSYVLPDEKPTAGNRRWPRVSPWSTGKDNVVLEGYDVVAYQNGKSAVKGSAKHQDEYKDLKFHFESEENRAAFAREPERFLPAYGSYCAFALSRGYPALANPKVFAIHRGRLYLFFDGTVRAMWEQSADQLIERSDRRWPEVRKPESR